MDIMLKNGDQVFDRQGAPVMLRGKEELLQQAALRLSIPKGTLPWAPQFGSQLHTLALTGRGTALSQRALSVCRQALLPVKGLSPQAADCRFEPGSGRLLIKVSLKISGEEYSLEVST